jgi:predicted Zn-ribbon and HTH transcriptional regulator
MDSHPVGEYSGFAAEQFLDRREEKMALDDEVVRHTLLWLAEGLTTAADELFQQPRAQCSNCGHDRRDHAVGGDADNPSPWPCNFPHSRGAPAILCYCVDYQPMADGETE